jgi:hypothetical protein
MPTPLGRCRDKSVPEMTDTALSALTVAWATTIVATSLFVVVLVLSRVWESAIYFKGLQGILNLDV